MAARLKYWIATRSRPLTTMPPTMPTSWPHGEADRLAKAEAGAEISAIGLRGGDHTLVGPRAEHLIEVLLEAQRARGAESQHAQGDGDAHEADEHGPTLDVEVALHAEVEVGAEEEHHGGAGEEDPPRSREPGAQVGQGLTLHLQAERREEGLHAVDGDDGAVDAEVEGLPEGHGEAGRVAQGRMDRARKEDVLAPGARIDRGVQRVHEAGGSGPHDRDQRRQFH